jgi:glycosyltransferase involved in cell wall biosynthesis
MWYLWLSDPEVRNRADIHQKEGKVKLKEALYEKLHSDSALKPLWNLLNSANRSTRYGGPFLSSAKDAPRKPAGSKLAGGSLGVNLVGYAMGELGIGEDVRMMARALEAAGIPFCILNRQPSKEIRQLDFSVVEHLSPEARYPVTLVCMTAFDTAALWLDRPDLFDETYVIGCWPWELPQWPGEWDRVYELVDEVWCSSRYTFDAFAQRSPVPVLRMPMAVTVESLIAADRSEFGLPNDRFLFLFVFDFMSYPARKNPQACVEAFLKAFPAGDEPVNLVLKASNAVYDSPLWRDILAACSVDSRILVLDANLSKGAVLALMKACDAYISLHRAEGFGRTLTEAMLLEKPVLATAYSGNADFLTEATGYPVPYTMTKIGASEYPCGKGQVWAEPDRDCAARHMREMLAKPGLLRSKAVAGQRYISNNYSPEVVGGKIADRLKPLFAELKHAPLDGITLA